MDTTVLSIDAWLGVINTGGLVALLGALVFLFMRGDIVSKRVYEKLSVQLVEQAVTRMTERVCQRLERMETAQAASITSALKAITEAEHAKTRERVAGMVGLRTESEAGK